MNTPLFELRNCTDLFIKARKDFSRLEEQVNSCDLFNCLCAVNHLGDWIKNDPQTEVLKLEVERIGQNQLIDAVRQLCNRARHFKVVSPTPKTSMELGYGSGRFGSGFYGIGEPT